MRSLAAAVALLAAVGCGASGGGSAQEALRDTARKLDDITSARIDLRMTAQSASSGPVGFRMRGPFALPERAGVPVADVELTELRGKQETTVKYVATGQDAYVVRDGKATKLSGSGGVTFDRGNGLGSLRIDGWLRDPKVSDGGDVGGTDTDKISAGLNVARAFDDLGRLGEQLKTSALANLRPLDARAREQVEKAARDATIEVWTGKEDRLLRRLVVNVVLTAAGEVPEGLKALVPVTLSLTMDLAAVNQPVKVEAPAT